MKQVGKYCKYLPTLTTTNLRRRLVMPENYPITKSSKSQVRKIYRNECWIEVINYPGYDASNHGRVRSYWNVGNHKLQPTVQRILSPVKGTSEYKFVNLYKGGVCKKIPIHRLVLEAFVGPCPDGMEACHNDGNPKNNHVSNLRWDTRKNNHADRIKHGTNNDGEKCGNSKLTEKQVLKIRKYYERFNMHKLASIFNVSKSTISNIINNKTWKHI